MNKRTQSLNRGFVIVTVALLLVVILAFAALATDAGVAVSSRRAAQNIADAAALAGASTFVLTPTAPQPQTAINHATSAATNQSIMGKPVLADDVEVTVANRVVTVVLNHVEDTFFARVVNYNSVDVSVRALAEASDVAVGSTCVKPFFIPNTVLLPEGSSTCNACDPASPEYNQVLIRDGQATAYAITQVGQDFTLRPWDPSRALAPGQFYSLSYGGSGAQVYENNISSCIQDGIFCNQCYGVEPGAMVGPTRQGVRALIGDPPDTYHAVGDYGDAHSDTSRSLVVVPVWDTCFQSSPCDGSTFCPDGKFSDTGRNIEVQVAGFALMFVQGFEGAGVQAFLINVFSCAAGGGGPGEVGPFSVPIRLVRPPA